MALDRDPRLLLDDILEAIEEIQITLRNKTFQSYRAHFGTRRIVERCIQIISEAAKNLPPRLTGTHPAVPWKNVRGVGDILRHEYHKIQDKVMWDTAVDHLPSLKAAVIAMRMVTADKGKPYTAMKAPRGKTRSRGRKRVRP